MSAVLQRNFYLRSKEHFQLLSTRCFSTELLQKPVENHSGKNSVQRTDEEWINAKPYSKIPSLSKFGGIRAFFPGGILYKLDLTEMHLKLRDTFGPIIKFSAALGRPEMLATYVPENFEKVFRTEGVWPFRFGMDTFSYFREHIRPDIYGGSGGLVNDHGKAWADLRTKVNPILLKPKNIKQHLPEVDEIAQTFIERVKDVLDPNTKETPANFGNDVNRWALESTATFALNSRLGLISNSKSTEGERLMNSVKKFFQLSYELEVRPSIWKYYKTPKFYELMDTLDTMTNINIKFINDALKKLEEKKKNNPNYEPEGVLEKLAEVDKQAAIIMAMDMLMVGVDTTSSLLLGVLYNLAKSPEAQEKLRKEIVTVLPNKDTPMTADKLVNLSYLRACIKEALRCSPVAAGTTRLTTQDVVLSGYQIPKNTLVVMPSIVPMWDEKYFPETKKFLPERWLRDNSSTEGCPSAKDVNPFVYLPFGFGVRMCVGRRIAEMGVEVMISRIIRNFRVSWNHPPMKYHSSIVITPIGDMKFKMDELSN